MILGDWIGGCLERFQLCRADVYLRIDAPRDRNRSCEAPIVPKNHRLDNINSFAL